MFADIGGVDGLVQDRAQEHIFLDGIPAPMRTVAAGVHLRSPEVRLVPNPFLFGHDESNPAGSFAHLPIHLVGTEDIEPIGVHLGDTEQAAGDAGELGALLVFGFQSGSYWLVLGVGGTGGARSHSAVLLDRVTFL